MPLQPAIDLLLRRAKYLRGEINDANAHPGSTTLTQLRLRLEEERACLDGAAVLCERDATGEEVSSRDGG